VTKSDLILIGAGGHSRSCIDVIEQEGKYRIAGLVGAKDEVGSRIFGYKVLTTDDGLGELAKQIPNALVSLGQIKSAKPRIRLYEQALEAGFTLPFIIAPTAYISPHATIGAGTIVMHGTIVNSGVLIEHDTQVANHCHISTGAILNGDTSIGLGSFIGSGSIIKEGVEIGAGSLVGMGLTVRHNLMSDSKYFGELKS
jgi:sugar O-acyltransferase (sialic acid O-acetyltransferase NeuD family)